MFRRSDLLDRRGEGKEREKTDHHRLSFHKRASMYYTIHKFRKIGIMRRKPNIFSY